jgi:hypothetical protein
MPNVETILREHVTLNADCIDRLYLNGYVPRLQRPENLSWFLHEHRKNPVVSPTAQAQRLCNELGSASSGWQERCRGSAEEADTVQAGVSASKRTSPLTPASSFVARRSFSSLLTIRTWRADRRVPTGERKAFKGAGPGQRTEAEHRGREDRPMPGRLAPPRSPKMTRIFPQQSAQTRISTAKSVATV